MSVIIIDRALTSSMMTFVGKFVNSNTAILVAALFVLDSDACIYTADNNCANEDSRLRSLRLIPRIIFFAREWDIRDACWNIEALKHEAWEDDRFTRAFHLVPYRIPAIFAVTLNRWALLKSGQWIRKMNSRFLVGWTPTLLKKARVELLNDTVGW